MHKARLVLVGFMAMSLFACSRSGRGGSGSPDELGEKIPSAEAGKELKDINFAFDSSAISDVSQSVLRENSKWMLDNPGKKVTVEGHCDERGTVEYNLALGERRAKSAFDVLRSLGVKAEQMNTISYGEELPLDPSHTESAWAQNRRAHFSIK